MVKRYKGGLMGSTEAVTSISDARGMWGTVQATQARNTGNWPALLTTETPGSGSGAGFANAFMTVSNVSVTDSNYTILNDTPNISTAGGFIRITGRGFVSGCVVYVGGVAATSTTFISSTEVRAQIAANTSNTLMVYVVNPDGSTGIKLSSLTFSGTPTWNTGATLSGQVSDVVFSVFFSATSDSAVSYALTSGSSLPPGTSLFANGLFTGTVTGISSDTTYSFSVDAIDTENQDTARTFSVTFSTGDQYFSLTPVLLNGEANVWIRDSSVNNFLPTIFGDTRPVAFSPYNSSWSVLLNGSTDYLTYSANADFAFGTGDFTVEAWIYLTANQAVNAAILANFNNPNGWFLSFATSPANNTVVWSNFNTIFLTSSSAVPLNIWTHVAVARAGTALVMYFNGVSVASATNSTNIGVAGGTGYIGFNNGSAYFTGYISNARVINGLAVYTGAFTPPTSILGNTQSSGTNIAAITAGSALLTLQDNRFRDKGKNALVVTPFGTPQARAFAPYIETDTTTGSAYFDGTGDYLTVADNAALELGASDFCVECWVYPTSTSGTGVIIDKRVSSFAPLLIWRSTDQLQVFLSSTGSSWNIASSANFGPVLRPSMWHHVAVYRIGTAFYGAVNGNVTPVASSSATLHNNSGNWFIGMNTDGSTNPYTGYISDVRMVVGSGVYTSANFTPTTSSLSSIANTQLLTLQYRRGDNNHRFIDESPVRALTTRAGNAHQGSFSPFSPAGWSAYFDGTGDYLTTATSATLTPQSTFTVECWVYTPTSAGGIVVDNRPASTNGNYLLFSVASGVVAVYVNSVNLGTTSAIVSTAAWTHIAYVRTGGVGRIYVNGGQQASFNDTTTYLETSFKIGDAAFSTGYWFGYISNFRFVNGTAVYTGNFTPQTSSLSSTQSAGTNIAAITGTSTALLTLQDNRFKDNSSNAFAISRFGDVKVQAFSPFRGSGIYSPTTHGGSAYFDGSGDYVYVAQSPAMTLGTNNHCIEFWMYPNGTQAQYSVPWYYNGSIVYYFSVGSDSNQAFLLVGGGAPWTVAITIGSTDYLRALNNWTHVAITRTGTAFRVFFNGVLVGYATAATNITAQTSAFSIGWDLTNATTYYKGWLSNFRVINGSVPAAYQTAVTTTGTSVFTPPTAVPAFEANTAIAMNFTHGGIVDATGRNTFETGGDTKISNVASKFGLGSLYFDGTTDSLVSPANPAYGFGTGDFTIECWVNFISTAGVFVPFAQSDVLGGSTNDKWFFALGSNTLRLQTHSSGGFTCTTPWTPSTGIWYHVAATRTSGTIRLFVDGTSGTVTTTGTPSGYSLSQNGLTIGAMSTPYYFNGYIDDFRITRFSRYTATFPVPTSAHLTR